MPYQIMAAVLWLCGELVAAMLAASVFGGMGSFCLNYVLALLGAAAGAGIAFLIMSLVPGQESSGGGLARSAWIPVIPIALALMRMCVAFGDGVLLLKAQQAAQHITASNPVFGTQLGNDGRVSHPGAEFPSYTKTVYLSFDLDMATDKDVELTLDWYFNGDKLYSYTRSVQKGIVAVALDCGDMGITELSPGQYKVVVLAGASPVTSAEFTVK